MCNGIDAKPHGQPHQRHANPRQQIAARAAVTRQQERRRGQQQRCQPGIRQFHALPQAPVQRRPAPKEAGGHRADHLHGGERVAYGVLIDEIAACRQRCVLEHGPQQRRGHQRGQEAGDCQRADALPQSRAARRLGPMCKRREDHVESQGQPYIERALRVARVCADGQQQRRHGRPAHPSAPGRAQRAVECGQHPGHPTEHGNEIEVAQVNEQRVAQPEGEAAKECSGGRKLPVTEAQRAQEHVRPQRSPPEVEPSQPLQRDVREVRLDKE